MNDKKTDNLERLRALPYVNASNKKIKGKTGVIKYNRSQVYPGYNLFANHLNKAYLLDMQGKAVHQWTFPDKRGLRIERVELLDNGDVLGVADQKALIKLNKDSQVIWMKNIKVHHDIALDCDCFWVAVNDILKLYKSRIVKFDGLLKLSPEGKILDKWSSFKNFDQLKKHHQGLDLDKQIFLAPTRQGWFNKAVNILIKPIKIIFWRILKPRMVEGKLNKISRVVHKWTGLELIYDYYHLNTIKILPDNPLAKKDKRFQPGNLLICLRHVNLIAILDKNIKKIVWAWGPKELDQPHMPTMLKNGNILIFDNGTDRGYSRIIELDPIKKQIVWQYQAKPPEKFFSDQRGSVQRLPNGNTLITDSQSGRVFEINTSGKIVWEFINFEKGLEDKKRARIIYRMMRIPKKKVESWLKQ